MMVSDLSQPGATESPRDVSLVYAYKDGLYVNLTSRCPTACAFCIKYSWNYKYRGYDLKLPKDPSIDEILTAALSEDSKHGGPADLSRFAEIIFCGYGESTYRLKEMKELAAAFRARGAKKLRLNTIGLGNLINGTNIAPELGEFLDVVSVSLNTVDPQQYLEMMRPLPEFREKALASTLEFIRECAKSVPKTFVTAVEMKNVDTGAVKKAAESAGAVFRARPFLDDYENE